jgi:hypothetical protein
VSSRAGFSAECLELVGPPRGERHRHAFGCEKPRKRRAQAGACADDEDTLETGNVHF